MNTLEFFITWKSHGHSVNNLTDFDGIVSKCKEIEGEGVNCQKKSTKVPLIIVYKRRN